MSRVVIIGGGIAGLAAAYRLRKLTAAAGLAARIDLVEEAARFGGKIVTERRAGYVVEAGPDAFIGHKPWALELVRELGLEDRLLPSNDARRGAFVLHRDRLAALPDGLAMLSPADWGGFLRSPLLSWPGKLRFALEPLVPRRAADLDDPGDDESLADFVRRRVGREALETLAEPLLAHIHVADARRMSLRATYPRLAELETRHGSLRRAARALRARGAPPPRPLFYSLEGGLGELVETLASRLDPATRHTGRRAVRISRAGDHGYRVRFDDGEEVSARAVVLATPAADAAALTAELAPELARRLAAIRYVSMATVSLGFRRRELAHPLDGFGFFVPRRARRRILACTWSSTKFDRRAPADGALLRVFLGGAGREADLERDDDALVRAVRDELRAIMRIDAAPALARVWRFPRGYPQYDVGHLARVDAIENTLPPGLFLAGSAYRGVGLPDCIHGGSIAAGRVVEHLRETASG